MVPPTRIELVMTGYQPIVIPFNYRGILVAGPGFEPGMLLAYETGVVAALPAIDWLHSLGSNQGPND
jgi:hypothetical protein